MNFPLSDCFKRGFYDASTQRLTLYFRNADMPRPIVLTGVPAPVGLRVINSKEPGHLYHSELKGYPVDQAETASRLANERILAKERAKRRERQIMRAMWEMAGRVA